METELLQSLRLFLHLDQSVGMRETLGKDFVEVWGKASIQTCGRRDSKGIYKEADEGKLDNVTGIQDPYEPEVNAELLLYTNNESPKECTQKVMDLLP
jgi:adenylylsulfate kinase-like enzyme